MAAATCTPVTRPAAARTLNVVAATADGRQALVAIATGRKAADYAVTRTDSGWLVGPAELPDAAGYRVSAAGGCTCPAGRFGKPCKHAAAVAKLVELRVLAR